MRYSSGRFQEFRFRLDQADDHGIPTSSLAGSFSMWPGALMRQSGCFEKGPNMKLRHKTIKTMAVVHLGIFNAHQVCLFYISVLTLNFRIYIEER